jgi:hypothetical protein
MTRILVIGGTGKIGPSLNPGHPMTVLVHPAIVAAEPCQAVAESGFQSWAFYLLRKKFYFKTIYKIVHDDTND